MKKPEIKREIVVYATSPNKQYVTAHIATERAMDWFVKEAAPFENKSGIWRSLSEKSKQPLPTDTYVIVSECYDVSEVVEYLSNPIYPESVK